jgi:putative ABC transport system permease protein
MGTVLQDLTFGWRMLVKYPGATFVVILALALGIGANTAVFSVVNTVLLRPLPFPEADRTVMLWQTSLQDKTMGRVSVSYPNFLDWREKNSVFEHLAAYEYRSFNITGQAEPERVRGSATSANLFWVLGVRPFLGRDFLVEEDRPGGNRVVILSYGLWQRRYGSDPHIIGKTITLDDNSSTVVGVMPANFRFPFQSEMWTPLAPYSEQMRSRRHYTYLGVIARLKTSISLAQAQSEMDVIARRIDQQYSPGARVWGITIIPLYEAVVGQYRSTLLFLQGAVSFVLLIACANCATVLLAQAVARHREIAVRLMLGASRSRIARQLLTENSPLVMLGGGLGLLLALWGNKILLGLNPRLPRMSELSMDARVLSFTLILSLLTGLIFGLAPVLQALKTKFNEALKEGGQSVAGGVRSKRLFDILVVTEIGLTMVLLIGAGLMIRSFLRLKEVDPGFNPKNLLTMQIDLPRSKYAEGHQLVAFFQRAIERIEALPGVQSVGIVSYLPFTGASLGRSFTIVGRPPSTGQSFSADYRTINGRYFRTMGIPLKSGREFSERDTQESSPVVIVNEQVVQQFFAGENPLGQHIKIGTEPGSHEIVGVVGDVKHTRLDIESKPEIYVVYAQSPERSMALVVRTVSNPLNTAAAVRGAVLTIDKDQPVGDLQTMEQRLATSLSQPRLYAMLLGFLGSVALILSIFGTYGVISYSVRQRTHEISVRMALGAQRRDLLKLIVGQGMVLALIGVAIGVVAALALTRILSSLLYGVSTTDVSTYAGISLLVVGVASLACYIPAVRAAKTDPMVALR